MGVDLGDGLRSPPGEQRRVHRIDGVDEGVGFLDESVGTSADRISCIRLRAGPAWASFSSSSRLSWKAACALRSFSQVGFW